MLEIADITSNYAVLAGKINLTGEKQEIQFDVSEFAAGVYIVELRSETERGIVHKMKFIKEN